MCQNVVTVRIKQVSTFTAFRSKSGPYDSYESVTTCYVGTLSPVKWE